MLLTNKEQVRAKALSLRKEASQNQTEAASLLAARFLALFPPCPDLIIGGYWPLGSEIDIKPILYHYHQAQVPVALPISNSQEILGFYPWRPGTALQTGVNLAQEPIICESAILPNLLILPLVAFDRRGQRLGRGGGYYDRLLDKLRKASFSFISVGVGFAVQEMMEIPVLAHDQALDWVISEKESIKCG